MIKLKLPLEDNDIVNLKAGDNVALTGVIVTARDTAHKYMIDYFIKPENIEHDHELYARLTSILKGGAIYHCGPVVSQDPDGSYHFVAAGPTTSIREEPYEADVIEHFDVKAVIGKGGMGPRTLKANSDYKAVYLSAIGGAATLIANSVKQVIEVLKLEEFGVPEAFWVIRVEDFPAVVTMDSHGISVHDQVQQSSLTNLESLTA